MVELSSFMLITLHPAEGTSESTAESTAESAGEQEVEIELRPLCRGAEGTTPFQHCATSQRAGH